MSAAAKLTFQTQTAKDFVWPYEKPLAEMSVVKNDLNFQNYANVNVIFFSVLVWKNRLTKRKKEIFIFQEYHPKNVLVTHTDASTINIGTWLQRKRLC